MDFEARAYGKYFLLDKLATGGMAEVFKAKTYGVQGFERLLVIKQILPHLTKDNDFVEMFIDEAKIAVELSHANIVQVFDLGKVGGNYFIAMEFIDGKDLRALLKKCVARKKQLPISHAVFIGAELLKGLDYAHRKRDSKSNEPLNIVHRDISPQNVVVSYEGEVKIVDFGIAKAERRINETQAGVLKGKFGYMSPEQAMGYEIDARSDLFACGILMFEMLTGRRLFMGENDLETLELIREADVPPITKYNPEVPEELEAIVYKALERDSDDRYVDAKSMQIDLTKFMYAHSPEFTESDLSNYFKKLFEKEIHAERIRLKQALEIVDDKYKRAKKDAAGMLASASSEVSFIHPNPRSMVTERDSSVFRGSNPSQPSQSSRPRSNRQEPVSGPITGPSNPSFSSSSHPSVRTGNDLSSQQTQFQPRPSVSFEVGESVRNVSSPSLFSRLKPWIAPAIFLGCSLFLVWLNFFRGPSSGPGPEPVETVVPAALGTIELSSDPSGAEVYIDNQLFGTTPVTLELKAEQDQRFLFRLAGYEEKELSIFVSEGENRPLTATLDPDRASLASLRITSQPPGATIYLNGESTGKRTPYSFDDFKRGGDVVVRLFKRGFAAEEATIQLQSESNEHDFELKRKAASLRIKTEPAGALVLVDGSRVGSSPVTAELKMNKSVRIVAKIEGFQDAEREMVIKEARETITLRLQRIIPDYGYVSINADPWAVVYMDGKLLGNTPILKTKVEVGKHLLELQHADYGKKQQTIEVVKANTEENPLLIITDLKE